MILGKDIHPSKEIYYLGARILELVNSSPKIEINILDTFQRLNEKERVSMNLFTLTLDWLFLLGSIKIANGRLEKCF